MAKPTHNIPPTGHRDDIALIDSLRPPAHENILIHSPDLKNINQNTTLTLEIIADDESN